MVLTRMVSSDGEVDEAFAKEKKPGSLLLHFPPLRKHFLEIWKFLVERTEFGTFSVLGAKQSGARSHLDRGQIPPVALCKQRVQRPALPKSSTEPSLCYCSDSGSKRSIQCFWG